MALTNKITQVQAHDTHDSHGCALTAQDCVTRKYN
jgi:hypothetical protein